MSGVYVHDPDGVAGRRAVRRIGVGGDRERVAVRVGVVAEHERGPLCVQLCRERVVDGDGRGVRDDGDIDGARVRGGAVGDGVVEVVRPEIAHVWRVRTGAERGAARGAVRGIGVAGDRERVAVGVRVVPEDEDVLRGVMLRREGVVDGDRRGVRDDGDVDRARVGGGAVGDGVVEAVASQVAGVRRVVALAELIARRGAVRRIGVAGQAEGVEVGIRIVAQHEHRALRVLLRRERVVDGDGRGVRDDGDVDGARVRCRAVGDGVVEAVRPEIAGVRRVGARA